MTLTTVETAVKFTAQRNRTVVPVGTTARTFYEPQFHTREAAEAFLEPIRFQDELRLLRCGLMLDDETVYPAHVLGFWDDRRADREPIRQFYTYKVKTVPSHILWRADPTCDHEVVTMWSGVECRKCHGTYCL